MALPRTFGPLASPIPLSYLDDNFTYLNAVNGGLVSVTQAPFNAVGDGVTDDTTAIQAAITAAGSGIVWFPSGTYLVGAGPLVVSNPSVTFAGMGETSILRKNTATASPILSVTAGNFQAYDLRFEGQYRGVNVPTIVFQDLGILVNGTSTPTEVDGIWIYDCSFDGFSDGGVLVQYAKNVFIHDLLVKNVGYRGIMGLSVRDVVIRGNIVRNVQETGLIQPTQYGISVTRDTTRNTTDSAVSQNVVIAENIVDGVPNWEAFDTHGGDTITFANNQGLNCYYGAVVQYDAAGGFGNNAPKRIVLHGNQFVAPAAGNRGSGIFVGGLTGFVATDILISANVIDGFGKVPNDSQIGAVRLSFVTGATVENNRILNSHRTALSLLAGCHDVRIHHNEVREIIQDSGSGFYLYLEPTSGGTDSTLIRLFDNRMDYLSNSPNFGIFIANPQTTPRDMVLARNHQRLSGTNFLRNGAGVNNVYTDVSWETEAVAAVTSGNFGGGSPTETEDVTLPRAVYGGFGTMAFGVAVTSSRLAGTGSAEIQAHLTSQPAVTSARVTWASNDGSNIPAAGARSAHVLMHGVCWDD